VVNVPEELAGKLPTRCADPAAQHVYVLYIAHVVAWIQLEAAFEATRNYRALYQQNHTLWNAARSRLLASALDAASTAFTEVAHAYVAAVMAVSARAGTQPQVDSVDMLDDLLRVHGPLHFELVAAWVRSIAADPQVVLSAAQAQGRCVVRHDRLVCRGSAP